MKKSAGILLYRIRDSKIEVFLVHPGGPFWIRKDVNAWSVPKGEFTDEEDPLATARREFEEETGIPVKGDFLELKPVIQKGGKQVFCYACKGNIDPEAIKSNTFEMEWPPRSGKKQTFPEIDRGQWFDSAESKIKIIESQSAFVDELEKLIRSELTSLNNK